MAARQMPDQRLLLKLLRYDAETGSLHFRRRPVEMFSSAGGCSAEVRCQQWNNRCAEKKALSSLFRGYRHGPLLGKNYQAHRIIWMLVTGEVPVQIDHINGDRSDNRFCNLRNVGERENSRNVAIYASNTSGCIGVYWRKDVSLWRARIKHEGRDIQLGHFKTLEEATRARRAAERTYGYHPNHGRRGQSRHAKTSPN